MEFSLMKMVEKALRGVLAGGVAILATFLSEKAGLVLTPEQQLALVAVFFGLISAFTNLLKHTLPKIFWWL